MEKNWKFEVEANVPQQENTSDCGVYTLQMIKFLVFNQEFPKWKAVHMGMIRSTMIMELSEQAIRWKAM